MMVRWCFVLVFALATRGVYGYDPAVLSVGGGVFKTRDPKVALQVEYKGSLRWADLRPQVGVMTSEFNSLYLYAGMGIDLPFCDYLVLTPSFSPGLYFKGNGFDLGHIIEFRSCLELAARLPNKCRLGVMFFHLSNASLSSRNPGANALMGFIAFPFR